MTKKAVAITERLMETESDEGLKISLYRFRMQKGINHKNLQEYDEALEEYRRVHEILDPMIRDGRTDLLPGLSMLLCNEAEVHHIQKRFPESLALMEEALSIVDGLINDMGRSDLVQLKISIQESRIRVMKTAGEYGAALEIIREIEEGYRRSGRRTDGNQRREVLERLRGEKAEIEGMMNGRDRKK